MATATHVNAAHVAGRKEDESNRHWHSWRGGLLVAVCALAAALAVGLAVGLGAGLSRETATTKRGFEAEPWYVTVEHACVDCCAPLVASCRRMPHGGHARHCSRRHMQCPHALQPAAGAA
jgi:hypothetical protein